MTAKQQMLFAVIGLGAIINSFEDMGLRQQNQTLAALVCAVGLMVYFKPSREVSEKRCVSIFGSENGE